MTKNKHVDIMQAAVQLFAERGYDGTTVPMIAEKANVGAGTVYRYFESKEALVNALFIKCLGDFINIMQSKFPEHENTRGQFRHVFTQLFTFAKEQTDVFLFIDSHCDGYYLNERSRESYTLFIQFFLQLIESGQKNGDIKPLPAPSLIAIVYGAFVMSFRLIQVGELEETPELLSELEGSLWDAIRIQ